MIATGHTDMSALVVGSAAGVLVAVACYVWLAAALAAVFAKLGGESWRGWVPVLNLIELFERGGVPGWKVVFLFIPVVNLYGIVLAATAIHGVNRRFGKGAGMTVLGILVLPVWASVLGWSSAQPSFDALPRTGPAPAGGGPLAQATALATPAQAMPYDRYETPVAPGLLAATPGAPADSPWAPVAPAAPVAGPAPELPVIGAPRVAPPVSPVPAPVAVPPVPPGPAPVAAVPPVPPAPAPTAVPPVPPAPAPTAVPPVPPVPAVPASPAPAAPLPPAPPLPPVPPAVVEAPPVPPAPPVPALVTPPPAPAVAPPAPTPAADVPALIAPDEDDDDLEGTVVVDRDVAPSWTLVLDDGRELDLDRSAVVVGRRPTSEDPAVLALAISDPGRTLSKVHARLDRLEDGWVITDLGSTNGVFLTDADGGEHRVAPQTATPVAGRFVLGTLGMRLVGPEDAA